MANHAPPDAPLSDQHAQPGAAQPSLWLAAAAAIALATALLTLRAPATIFTIGALAGGVLATLDALPVLLGFWLGAAGWGYLVSRIIGPTLAVRGVRQVACGAAVQMLLLWLLAWAGAIYAVTGWLTFAIGGAMLAWQLTRPQLRTQLSAAHIRLQWRWLLPVGPLTLLWLVALIPPSGVWKVEAYGYDVITYHLPIAQHWLNQHQMVSMHHNIFSHLPSLVEAVFAYLGAMQGTIYKAIPATQLLHASAAVVTAFSVLPLVRRIGGRFAGVWSAALLLAMPWVLIVGSLAYNEMFAMAFSAAALDIACEAHHQPWRRGALIGFLCGVAALAKLTATLLLAVPLGLVLLATLLHAKARKQQWKIVTAAAIAGLLTLSPWFARNATWTGNPVFPFASSQLGTGHWTQQQADRWNRAVYKQVTAAQAIKLLNRNWLTNAGYGAVGGAIAPEDPNEVARFERENGLPLLWLLALGGVVIGLRQSATRRITLALLTVLILQLLIWLLLTHVQSRFLIFSLLCALPLAALSAGWFDSPQRTQQLRHVGRAALVVVLVIVHVVQIGILHQQMPQDYFPAMLVAALPSPKQLSQGKLGDFIIGDHPLSHLPQGSHVLMVGDANVLYVRRDVSYATAFDRNLFAQLAESAQTPKQMPALLRERGITHVMVNWNELERIKRSYGALPLHDPQSVHQYVRSLRVVEDAGGTTVFAVP